MDYNEKYTGNKEKFYFFLKDEIIRLFKDKLKIDGHLVNIPDDEELNYQFNLDSNRHYGDFTIKVTWGKKTEQNYTIKEESNQYEEFDENSKQAEMFKETTTTNNDGMEINTNVSFDYEPSTFK
ncbi:MULTISPECIES: hypothetical protein [Clostridium]|uniref:Amphi-Trp domain-containing protein n=1 Tax=Clostridium frigoriphilum TaxID=443253 RepID=A0ABU7UTU7_9CLOT|nr:hypothetical protein [Clostridium sp. DSM 17811]MBU3101651.1 hypothetical protein [Clostridium sp. DSM 17811]